jgi:DNA helicase-4
MIVRKDLRNTPGPSNLKSDVRAIRLFRALPDLDWDGDNLSTTARKTRRVLTGVKRLRARSVGPYWILFGLSEQGRFRMAALGRGKSEQFLERIRRDIVEKSLRIARQHDEDWKRLLSADKYLAQSDVRAWLEEMPPPTLDINPLSAALKIERKIGLEHHRLTADWNRRSADLHLRNEGFVEGELLRMGPLFDAIGTCGLTEAQRNAVVRNEDANLVLAGAGTGKTETIVARCRYLVEQELAQPNQILVLSYNRSAAKELHDRMAKVGLRGVYASTFHSLGNRILKDGSLGQTSLAPEAEEGGDMSVLLQKVVDRLLVQDADFSSYYTEFLVFWRLVTHPPHRFNSMAEYAQHVNSGRATTLTSTKVRSREELLVADFLTVHGVRYEYEKVYIPKIQDGVSVPHRPDFYLPDYDIYLEHFALDRGGAAPEFLGGSKYVEGVGWKRGVHVRQGTTLIESHSWHLHERDTFGRLREVLQGSGVKLERQTDETILSQLKKQLRGDSNLARFLTTFNSLQKNRGLASVELDQMAELHCIPSRAKAFLQIQKRVFDAITAELDSRSQIDFDDMILRATKVVDSGAWTSSYTHILVDEFQDASKGRADFVRALRGQVQFARTFCVGDDWQSIYRFAGSDVRCVTEFESEFGLTAHTTLDKTFRFGCTISCCTAAFVTRNPKQSQKLIEPADPFQSDPIVVVYQRQDRDSVYDILEELAVRAAETTPTVYVLARYKRVIAKERMDSYRRQFRSSLNIKEFTIHSSKGMQADYVIVDKVVAGRFGIPSLQEDDPLLELVLGEPEAFPYAEERRLFYVALTRAKKQLFLVTEAGAESPFLLELIEESSTDLIIRGDPGGSKAACPFCGTGTLIDKLNTADKSRFFICSNAPVCAYKDSACLNCGVGHIERRSPEEFQCAECREVSEACPKCKTGRLVPRAGKYGAFIGCSGFEKEISCDYKRKLHAQDHVS